MSDYDLTWSVADNVPLENAATVSMCGLTAAQGLFYRMGFPCPFYGTPTFGGVEQPVNVLIYGSTTNVGLFAAQLVRIAERTAGKTIRLIGAASTSKHAMLREAPYQYDILVDYRKSSWTEEVLQATGGSGVLYAIDAVSYGSTVADVESTLSANGKFVAYRTPSIGNFDLAALEIKPVIGPVWEGLGVEIEYHGKCIIVCTLERLLSNAYAKGAHLPANQEAREFAAAFFKFIGRGATSDVNVLQSVPIRLMPGGIEKIVSDGFSVLRQSSLVSKDGSRRSMEAYLQPVSAEKLVYKI